LKIEELERLGVSDKVIQWLKGCGIRELYPPQEEALKTGVLNGRSLLMATPTASGKTLVAVLSAIRRADEGLKTLYLTPLKAIASEKYEELRSLEELGYKVAISTGDYDSSDPWLIDYDIIVTTNEKADSLIRHKASWLSDIGLVVADEIHLIDSEERGPTLEILLARLMRDLPGAQIIALSATVSNAEELAEWLGASLVKSEWRPVPLREGVYYNGAILFSNGEELRVPIRHGGMIDLTLDTIRDGGQVLIFRSTRRTAVSSANKLAKYVDGYLNNEERRELKIAADKLLKLSEDRVTQELARCVSMGVAFHHAGLTYAARKLVEDLFRKHLIKAIAATPTLAAGVNVPARRVILPDMYRFNVRLGYSEPIPVMEYKQFAGRAGRPGYDEYGEAIIVAQSKRAAKEFMELYVRGEPEMVRSKLDSERALRSHILAAFATDLASDLGELEDFFLTTFYASTVGVGMVRGVARSIYNYLLATGFIENIGGRVRATPLGRRVSELYIDPASAETIMELLSGLDEPNTFAYIQIIVRTEDMPKLPVYRGERREWERLFEVWRRKMHPSMHTDYYFYEDWIMSLREFKTSLLLWDWINEEGEDRLVEIYKVGPGDIYNYVQTAKWVAYAAYELAKLSSKLEKHALELNKLYKRIEYGVKEELLELTLIPGVGRVRARILYMHGYKSLQDLAEATVEKLSKLPGIGVETAKRIIEYVSLKRF